MYLDFVNSPLKTKCEAIEDTSVSYYLCHIVKALTKRGYSILNKTRENVVVTNPKGVAQVCHTTKKKKTKTKNRKKKQNLDLKGNIFNIVHLLTI